MPLTPALRSPNTTRPSPCDASQAQRERRRGNPIELRGERFGSVGDGRGRQDVPELATRGQLPARLRFQNRAFRKYHACVVVHIRRICHALRMGKTEGQGEALAMAGSLHFRSGRSRAPSAARRNTEHEMVAVWAPPEVQRSAGRRTSTPRCACCTALCRIRPPAPTRRRRPSKGARNRRPPTAARALCSAPGGPCRG